MGLAGQRFGRLVVEEFAGRPNNVTLWRCRCDCENLVTVRAGDLRNGHTSSCGCLLREAVKAARLTHGHSRRGRKTPEYYVWQGMLNRCRNPKNKGWQDYGGRGIAVCERWHSFAHFIADMGPRPSDDLTIERKDNDGDYAPGNCIWATRAEQAKNSRRWPSTRKAPAQEGCSNA